MSTVRKMVVNAFTKIAEERWGDSKDTAHSIRRYGFKNPRDWGRHMANMYSWRKGHEIADELLDLYRDAREVDAPVTQHDIDYFAEEEISCW